MWIILVGAANAATYYVDFDSGDDTQSGLSPSAAWRRCPGDLEAEGLSRVTRLLPGDRVQFRGGVRYHGTINVNWSGVTNAPIVYDGNSSRQWDVGPAIIDQENGIYTSAFLSEKGVQWITIAGFVIRNVGGVHDSHPMFLTPEVPVAAPRGGTGLRFEDASKNLVFQDLLIEQVGQWRNTVPFSGPNSISGTGILLENNENVVIRRCEFTKMRVGVSIKCDRNPPGRIKNISIEDCDLHNYMVWPIDIAARSAGVTFDSIRIVRSRIHDYHEFDSGNWNGYGEKPHSDGIIIRTTGLTETIWKNITIAGNQFYAGNTDKSNGGTAAIYISEGPSVNIYNNSFCNVKHSRVIGVGHNNPGLTVQTVRIYNNTFIGNTQCIMATGESNANRRRMYINNNIFYRSTDRRSSNAIHYDLPYLTELNNNLYFNEQVAESESYVAFVRGAYWKLSQLRAAGMELNGKYGDPAFVNVDPRNVDISETYDIRLRPESAARQVGKANSRYFRTDMTWKNRSFYGPWDAGAMMYTTLPVSVLNP